MVIKAKWVNTPPPYSNMTTGKVYLVWGAINGGCQVVDDTGAVFAAPGLDNAAFWQLVSITDVGDISIYP